MMIPYLDASTLCTCWYRFYVCIMISLNIRVIRMELIVSVDDV